MSTRIFHYSFMDGTDLCVEFTEWGTILISKQSDIEEYIKSEELKIVIRLEIKDKKGNIIETSSYELDNS